MQTCLICGPDKDCKGHPSKHTKTKTENIHIPQGKCPICFVFGKKKTSNGKHKLSGASEISKALKLGPVGAT